MPVGHMATWFQTNGGKFGKAEWMWLDGSCVAMLLVESSSWVKVQRLTDGKLKSMTWISFLKSLPFSDDLRVEVRRGGCPLLGRDSSQF